MSPAHASDATFTVAGVLVVLFVMTAMLTTMERRPGNVYLTVFVAASLGSPLFFVGHMTAGLALAAVGLACIVPAYRLALTDGDDGGGGGEDAPPGDRPPDSGPDLWSEFEREFWSHVDRTRELVHMIAGTLRRTGGAFVFRDPLAA